MKRVATLLFAGLWLIAAEGVGALELGEIEVGSLRGEPLMARIALDEMQEGEFRGLRVGLARADDFARAGIERAGHLVSLEFEVVAEGGEPAHIMIRGRDPVASPFTTFLVEALWPGGRVLREYTVLLDAAPPDPVASYGPVRNIDTLWSLAGRYRPEGVSVQRMMLTILALNPHAFTLENVNALREGAVLEIPSAERIGSDGKASAMQEVRRQNEAWQANFPLTGATSAAADIEVQEPAGAETVAPTPDSMPTDMAGQEGVTGGERDAQVRVVVPGPAESAEANEPQVPRAELDLALEEADSRRREIFELSARLDEAERLIVDLQRLVELKDDDIAGLQRKLATEAEAVREARSEASEQARVAARAQAQAQAQAEAAAQAREEVLLHAEAAALAQADFEALSTTQTVAAMPEPLPEPEEEAEVAPADAGSGVQLSPAEKEEGEGVQGDEVAASLSLLKTLENVLGFSPVVGGVGLVGVILILGGLIALMRRRGAGREYSDDDVIPDEDDVSSNLWDDEVGLEEDVSGSRDGDASASPRAQAVKNALRTTDDEPEIEGFDIGIELDEELARSFEEGVRSDSGSGLEDSAVERALAPVEEAGARRSASRSALDPAPAVRREFPPGAGALSVSGELGASSEGEFADADPGLERGRQSASSAPTRVSGGRAPLDDGTMFTAGEGLAGDVDELQTKLDLAQTYIDMEDFEDARALLREVQAEGGLEQRAIARYLAGKLP